MKICHITISHASDDTRIFKKECKSLCKVGYEIILIAPHGKNDSIDGINILNVNKWKNMIERIYFVPKEAIALANKIDAALYHFHDPELLPHMILFSKKTGKTVIWDAHENYLDSIYQHNSLKIRPLSWLVAKYFNYIELKSLRKKYFGGVITINDKMAKKYEHTKTNICTIANYADIDYYKYDGRNSLSKIPRLVSVGMQIKERGILEIAKSFKLIKKEINAEIYFSGKFNKIDLRNEVHSILTDADSSKKYWKIEGEVSHNHLINLSIPKAWAGLVLFDLSNPNNRNGLPNRLFEYWANAVPVIVSGETEVARLVEYEGGGLILKNNTPQ
ncbi:MAG: hypothetical protein HOL23_06055, partial [Gammaproteobacteria bacterium]|nr:hypothetical protein [Gammaproteobacteria bacterium]